METIITSGEISSTAIDFSLVNLFLKADLVVKSVIIILIISSIWSWKIIVEKLVRMKRLKQLDREFDEIFWSGNSFEDLYETFNFNTNSLKADFLSSNPFCEIISNFLHNSSLIVIGYSTLISESNIDFLLSLLDTDLARVIYLRIFIFLIIFFLCP